MLRVVDNGRGVADLGSDGSISDGHGRGLANISERARLLGGRGAVVEWRVPLPLD